MKGQLRYYAVTALALAAGFQISAATSGSGTEEGVGSKPPFFAFENALHDGNFRTHAEQAALLRSLGYDGISASGPISTGYLAAFENQGLKVFNTYLELSFDSSKPPFDPSMRQLIRRLAGHGTALWISIKGVTLNGVKLKPSSPAGDELVLPALREWADLGRHGGTVIALYPHTGLWCERVIDAVRLAAKANRPNIGATFNLCHWLKVEGDRDPRPILKVAMPYLFFVSINGADGGDTRTMPWNRLIQPLGRGSYDVGAFLRTLREFGYGGPIGFQGFGIKGDSQEILRESMDAWRRLDR